MKYKPGCSPTQSVVHLKEALKTAEYAHHCAVLWFAEILRRNLFRQLGHSSMGQFAAMELGFSPTKTSNFLKICSRLNELPKLRHAMASGRLGYTKALEVIKVATPASEEAWVNLAEGNGRAVLRRHIKKAREMALRRKKKKASGKNDAKFQNSELPWGDGTKNGTPIEKRDRADIPDSREDPEPHSSPGEKPLEPGGGDYREHNNPSIETLASSLPVRLNVEFEPEQWARFEALEAQLRERGHKTGGRAKAELLLEALETLVLAGGEDTENGSDNQKENKSETPENLRRRNPVQIMVHHCPRCATAQVVTNRGEKTLSPSAFERLLCDAQILEPGKPNRSTLTSSTRLLALARDRHQCRAQGCHHTQHLEVHHVIPRSKGGTNRLDNLITLCRGCHRLIHERGELPSGKI